MRKGDFYVLFVVGLALLPVSALGQDTLAVTVSTNKQNYDRGQFVLITVEVQKSGTPLKSTTVYYELIDPLGEQISSGFMITDSTGRYTKQVMIGNSSPLGSYTVYVSVTVGDESASATASFQTVPEFNSSVALLVAIVAAVALLTAFRKKENSVLRRAPACVDLTIDRRNSAWSLFLE
jgi:hypothetical protein